MQTSLGQVIWVTGLSGAGKTTLAKEIVQQYWKSNISPIYLDGDDLRQIFNKGQRDTKNHRREERADLAFKYSRLCKLLSDHLALNQ